MISVNGTGQSNYLPLPDRCSDDALVEMAQIVKTFKNAAGEFSALKNVTACFYQGEFVSVVGKSGSGKSTLVNMITGIDHPTSGKVRIGDAYVHDLSESDMSIWRGKNLGIVFQFFQLLPTMSLLENVMLPMYLSGQYAPVERERRALSLLKLVGLEGLENKLPAAVSGGQQQCAAIARALANDPPILIADEPTGNLDSRTAEEIFELFAGLIDQGKTILMVTHDISLSQRTTRTLLISDGELINPFVAGALPHLDHTVLLWLSHNLKAQHIPAGANVPDMHGWGDWLVLVTSGHLEVLGDLGAQRGQILLRLGPGDPLSSLDLQAARITQAGLRAGAEGPAELLVVEGPELGVWLNETPANRSILQRVEQASPLTLNGGTHQGYRGLTV